jgi:hypothetical protein
MTETEIQCLKDQIEKLVEIETSDGEILTARVISVFDDENYDEHELFYEVISTNMPYENRESSGGYALAFSKILSVCPRTS